MNMVAGTILFILIVTGVLVWNEHDGGSNGK